MLNETTLLDYFNVSLNGFEMVYERARARARSQSYVDVNKLAFFQKFFFSSFHSMFGSALCFFPLYGRVKCIWALHISRSIHIVNTIRLASILAIVNYHPIIYLIVHYQSFKTK